MASHRILLTGANGFVASHILSQLLAAPAKHSVRAVVRSQSKVDDVKALFPSASAEQLDFAIVPDMTAPRAFDEALKSDPPFDIVMHTASPFLYKAAASPKDFLDPAIKGTTEILEGIQRVAKESVKRVVVTGSFASVGGFGQFDDTNKVYTEDDWNPVTLEAAEGAGDNKNLAYLASKKFAEIEAWKVQKSEGVKWDMVMLCPPMVYGPIAHKISRMDGLNESVLRIWNLFLKDKNPDGEIPDNGIPLFIDVRDLAEIHLLSMDAPDAGNQRIITGENLVSSQEIADIMRAEIPGADEIVPKGELGKQTLPEGQYKADNTKAKKLLGIKYRTNKDTFADLGRQLLELSKAL